jgi:hypothetical protein
MASETWGGDEVTDFPFYCTSSAHSLIYKALTFVETWLASGRSARKYARQHQQYEVTDELEGIFVWPRYSTNGAMYTDTLAAIQDMLMSSDRPVIPRENRATYERLFEQLRSTLRSIQASLGKQGGNKLHRGWGEWNGASRVKYSSKLPTTQAQDERAPDGLTHVLTDHVIALNLMSFLDLGDRLALTGVSKAVLTGGADGGALSVTRRRVMEEGQTEVSQLTVRLVAGVDTLFLNGKQYVAAAFADRLSQFAMAKPKFRKVVFGPGTLAWLQYLVTCTAATDTYTTTMMAKVTEVEIPVGTVLAWYTAQGLAVTSAPNPAARGLPHLFPVATSVKYTIATAHNQLNIQRVRLWNITTYVPEFTAWPSITTASFPNRHWVFRAQKIPAINYPPFMSYVHPNIRTIRLQSLDDIDWGAEETTSLEKLNLLWIAFIGYVGKAPKQLGVPKAMYDAASHDYWEGPPDSALHSRNHPMDLHPERGGFILNNPIPILPVRIMCNDDE